MLWRRRPKPLLILLPLALAAWVGAAYLMEVNLRLDRPPLARADAILVLSGSTDYRERCAAAAAQFAAGTAEKILLTNDGRRGGWDRERQSNPSFVERARDELIRGGVPEPAIEILPGTVDGTRDEAFLLATTARARDWRAIQLVTSEYHARRTLWTFEKASVSVGGPVAFGVVSPREPEPTRRFNWWLSAQGWREVGFEYVKMAYYRLLL